MNFSDNSFLQRLFWDYRDSKILNPNTENKDVTMCSISYLYIYISHLHIHHTHTYIYRYKRVLSLARVVEDNVIGEEVAPDIWSDEENNFLFEQQQRREQKRREKKLIEENPKIVLWGRLFRRRQLCTWQIGD